MVDAKAKAAIPAWQEAPSSPQSATTGSSQLADKESTKPEDSVESQEVADGEAEAIGDDGRPETLGEETQARQLERAKVFLQDEDVKSAPEEKKREFLESKGIPLDLVDRALSQTSSRSAFGAGDFEDFQRSQNQDRPQTQSIRSRHSAPPIITYPEFLIEAHKPPPIITAQRLLNATYILAGISTLVHAASKHLVAPMGADLNDARHEYFTHNQTKLDEMNERLSKLASRIPPPKKTEEQERADTIDDGASIDSDPTELFHRDIGVQTSPVPSRRMSTSGNGTVTSDVTGEPNAVSHDVSRLESLQSHLNEMALGSERVNTASQECQGKTSELHHYLDTLKYQRADGAMSMWGLSSKIAGAEEKEKDGIQELKQSIRSVKGAMLSAKRFPAARGR